MILCVILVLLYKKSTHEKLFRPPGASACTTSTSGSTCPLALPQPPELQNVKCFTQIQTKFYPKKSARTWNQIRVISLSGCVTNSDASCQKSKIDFQPYFWNPQMLSFSYNTMGSKVNGLAVREHFLSKNALKRSILAAMTPERLASEKGMTQNFKGIINFYMSCGNFGAYTSK